MKDEDDFVEWVSDLVDHEANHLGHNEDAVAIKVGQDFLVINIDGWVESTDRPVGLGPIACGLRAVANAASDIIAKGAIPEAMVISMSMNEGHREEYVEIIQGFESASQRYGIAYLGGDMNQSKDLVIDVTVWGRTETLIKRSTASAGELVCWLGPPLGMMSAVLGILVERWNGDRNKALEIMANPLLFPQFVDIPATASIDSSDGLARSLHLLAEQSGVKIVLDTLSISDQWVAQVRDDNHLDDMDLILYGGEELGIVFTINQDQSLPDGALILGKTSNGHGVWFGNQRIENRGWDHLKQLNSKQDRDTDN